MGFFLIFGIFAAVFVLLLILAKAQQDQANTAWRSAASQLGLHYKPGAFLQGRRIDGKYKGQWIQIDTFRRGSGKSSTTYTRYEVAFADSLNLGLHLSRQGFFSQVWTFLGGQDILTGDEEFDLAIVVRGHDDDEIRRFLTPARKDRIYTLLSEFQECTIDDNKIQCCLRGVEKSSARLISIIQQMTNTARYLGRYFEDEAAPPVLSLAEPERDEESAEIVPVKPLYGELIDKPQQEPESLQKQPVEEAKPLPRQVEKSPPKVPDAGQWPPKYALPASPVEQPGKEDEPLPEVTQPPPPGVAASTVESSSPPLQPAESAPAVETPGAEENGDKAAADVHEICQELFQSDLMSSQIKERFETKFKDQTIHWSGKLDQVTSYYYDMVFGNEPGTKADVDIHEVSNGIFGSDKVQAVVQLPKEMEDTLRSREGEQVSFTGRLIGCDAFMRKLFVAGGTME